MQPQQRGTLIQPFHSDLQTALHNTIELRTAASEIAAPKPAGATAGKKDFEAFSQKNFRKKSAAPKWRKSCAISPSHTWCSHSNRISTLLYSTMIYSTPLYSTPLCSTLLFSTLPYLYSTSTLLYCTLTLPYLYSTLPLLYLFTTSRRCSLGTMVFGLLRMWLNDLSMQVPIGHNDLRAIENVTWWYLSAGAHWIQWSLGSWE